MKLDEVITQGGAAALEFADYLETMERHCSEAQLKLLQKVGAHLIKRGLQLRVEKYGDVQDVYFDAQYFRVLMPKWDTVKRSRLNVCKIGTTQPYSMMTLGSAAKMDVVAVDSGFKALRAAELQLAVYLK
jgi:hypothetical protein